MNSFFYSRTMLCILAALLLLVFFLPDLIGPYPALIIGTIVIGCAFFVYNKWSQVGAPDESKEEDQQSQ